MSKVWSPVSELQKRSSELSFVILFQKDQTPHADYGLLIK
jgi:hypothetical protein